MGGSRLWLILFSGTKSSGSDCYSIAQRQAISTLPGISLTVKKAISLPTHKPPIPILTASEQVWSVNINFPCHFRQLLRGQLVIFGKISKAFPRTSKISFGPDFPALHIPRLRGYFYGKRLC